MRRLFTTLGIVWLCSAQDVIAYDPNETHTALSEAAMLQSILADSYIRDNLGIRDLDGADGSKYPNSKGIPRTIKDLIRDGAKFEDDNTRSLNHFFNPVTGQALHIDPLVFGSLIEGLQLAGVAALNLAAQTSPDWVLGANAGGRATLNTYTWGVAREWFFQATTNSSSQARAGQTGMLFETLGRMVHHIQDMAQPQHVRNDLHLQDDNEDDECLMFSNPVDNPICYGYLQLTAPSVYESWTASLESLIPMTGYPAVYGPGSDGLDVFVEPKRFWTHIGKGLADFTNRNFLSSGTMFDSPPILGMPIDILARDLCSGAVPPCNFADLDHFVTFYPSVVDDQFRIAAGGENPYAAAASIFDPEFQDLSIDHRPLYTVNRFTFARDHTYLLPRAVGYSAGLINYFFRGAIEISLPDEGIYSIVDNSVSGCGAACAFNKVKLKLKNVTPGTGLFQVEPMGAGRLWAVVKYHLNNCYRPDLSGEEGGSDFRGNRCRSEEEYISVSARVLVETVSASQPQQMVFDFSANPIPVNASDVFLQVVFRGVLGLETGAVAVATKDIAEPSFYKVANITDYEFDVGDNTYHLTPPSGRKSITNVRIAFGASSATAQPLADLNQLAGGEHAQLALLTERGDQQFSVSWSGHGAEAPTTMPFYPSQFTQDGDGPAAGLYQRACGVVLRRGLYDDSAIYIGQFSRGGASSQYVSTSAAKGSSLTTEKSVAHSARPSAVRDLRCATPPSTGLFDLSTMTPFNAIDAKAWDIQF